jgi:hypothetical protein
MTDPKLEGVRPEPERDNVTPIKKPKASKLERFRVKTEPAIANVGVVLAPLPIFRIADAGDYVRLHPSEDYWSDMLYFVTIPIPGQAKDTTHLIVESLALQLDSRRTRRFRLALASKPFDVFFLCQVPFLNLDNLWNLTALEACEQARQQWVTVSSRKPEGVESYKIGYAKDQDAFPEPRWPTDPLDDLVVKAFAPHRLIEDEGHPSWCRLIGQKPPMS